ncbi:MAG: uracil-DNA glycosylase [Rhodobacteraceae bacterium]|nr:uracil-DNA glycosylase [Paracoccaceae bacterium]
MIEEFVAALRAAGTPENCVNPYAGYQPGIDAHRRCDRVRADQLVSYLNRRRDSARLILIAEAPGYQGARFTGVPMTCERTLLGWKTGVPSDLVLSGGHPGQRTSSPRMARNRPEQERGITEPTSTIVWKELVAQGMADRTVLWNVFPFHPVRPGNPLSNRTPTPAEVQGARGLLEMFLGAFPGCAVACVGKTALTHLAPDMPGATALRHPANGGAGAFRRGFAALVRGL